MKFKPPYVGSYRVLKTPQECATSPSPPIVRANPSPNADWRRRVVWSNLAPVVKRWPHIFLSVFFALWLPVSQTLALVPATTTIHPHRSSMLAVSELNRLAQVNDAHSGVTSYAYDGVGNLQSFSYGNGVYQSYQYDALNRLTNLVAVKSLTTLASYGYALGPTGNRLSVTELSGRTASYAYDNLYRLRTETVANDPGSLNGTVGYTLDAVGNRSGRSVTGALVNVLPSQTFTYNSNDWLNVGIDHSYDANGNTTIGVSGRREGVAGVYDSRGYDGHGSVRFLTDATGQITDRYQYDAFGNLIGLTGSTPNLYLYTGEQYDPDLGFYYLRARYSNPDSGRFWTMDSCEGNMSDPRSLHKYLYCAANPANAIDPSGNTLLETLGTFAVKSILFTATGAAIGAVIGGVDGAIDDNNTFANGFRHGGVYGARIGFGWTFKFARPLISLYIAFAGGYGTGNALMEGQLDLAAYRAAVVGAFIGFGRSGPRVRTAQEIGDLGEARAIEMLEKSGWTDLVVIKNESGNGIDVAGRTPDGRPGFGEIKSTDGGRIGDLSPRQANMDTFVRDILTQASTRTGRYQNTPVEMQNAAIRLLRDYNADPAQASGVVVGIDLATGAIYVQPWPGRASATGN